MGNKKPEPLDRWLWGHKGKRKYPSRRAARKRAVYLALRKGHWGLRPYPCQWIGPFYAGEGDWVHWHLGHRPRWDKRKGLRKRAWYWSHKIFIWPLYKLRSRYRRWRKGRLGLRREDPYPARRPRSAHRRPAEDRAGVAQALPPGRSARQKPHRAGAPPAARVASPPGQQPHIR